VLKLAVPFACGIIAFKLVPFFPFSTIAVILSICFIFLFGKRGSIIAFLILAAILSGFFYSSARYVNNPEIKFPDEKVFIDGVVSDVPEMYEGKVRFTVSNVKVNGKKLPGKVRLVIFEEQFGEHVTEYLVSPGDRISAMSILKDPAVFRNPGVYSYDIKKDGIIAVGYVKQMRFTKGVRGLLDSIYNERQILAGIIDRSMSEKSSALHKAIIPGLKRGIDLETRESFSAAGVAHLLSISGTHFGLLAFIIFQSVRRTVKYIPTILLKKMTLYITPSQVAVITSLPVLFIYALISGASIPTVRSLIMVFIYMLALFLGRKGQWLNSLSIAALIIMLWQPYAVFEISFQLSFAAVLSIGCVLENRARKAEHRLQTTDTGQRTTDNKLRFEKIYEKVKTGILMTVAAVMGTAPIVALVFKQFPLIAPVTNLMVTPLVCFVVLPLGFFTGFGAMLFNMPLMPLNVITDIVTGFALWLIAVLSRIPYASFHIHNPSVLMVACYYISLMLIFKSTTLGKYKWKVLPLALVVVWYLGGPYPNPDNIRITFLDVGQGEAALVELPDKKIMLIDGGTERPDTGRMVVAPFLWSKGIKEIDIVVMSHQHADHAGGLTFILSNFEIREFWLNGRPAIGAEGLFRKIDNKEIPFKFLKRGDVLRTEAYTISVLHPYDEFYPDSPRGEFSSQNSDSMVMKIESKGLSILFSGDIEKEAEDDLMYLGKWLKCDIIKVPHHGGRTSSSTDFIEAVKPDVAVISAGMNNRFGHPHYETLKRYKAAGARVFRTDTDGAVTITPGDSDPEVTTYRDTEFKVVKNWRDEIRNLRLLLRL
jgi:competence protein ComEC